MSTDHHKMPTKPNDPAHYFDVPEGYFENLPHTLLSRVHEEVECAEQQKRPLIDVLRPYLYLAAMFIGLALFLNLLPRITPHKDLQGSMASTELQATDPDPTVHSIDDELFDQFIWEETQDEYLVYTYYAD